MSIKTSDELAARGFQEIAPDVFVKRPSNPQPQPAAEPPRPQPAKRVRQSAKPLMNKLEAEWFDVIKGQYPNYPPVRAQAKRYRLANGVTFTPDFTASRWPKDLAPSCETAWEVKGIHAWDDALVKLKLAAHEWPEVQWILVWKQNGEWRQQVVLP